MLTADHVETALRTARDTERAARTHAKQETDPRRQKHALDIYRHAHALVVACEDWQTITTTT